MCFHGTLNFTYINVVRNTSNTQLLSRKGSRGRRTRERGSVNVLITTIVFNSMMNYTQNTRLYISFQLILLIPSGSQNITRNGLHKYQANACKVKILPDLLPGNPLAPLLLERRKKCLDSYEGRGSSEATRGSGGSPDPKLKRSKFGASNA